MDNFEKYSRLMLMIVGGIIAFILAVALVFFALRLFSIAVFHIPGFDFLYQLIIVLIPYFVFFAAYYYLFGRIKLSKSKASRISARILIFSGALFCTLSMILSVVAFLSDTKSWTITFRENEHYAYIIQLIVLLIIAAALAAGDSKEKDWMERGESIKVEE